MSEDLDLGAAARWYANHDIPVFPLKPRRKEPATRHGFKDATTSIDQIAEWWRSRPDFNIGIPTGSTSGFFVLDCDPRNGAPSDRGELIEQLGAIPETGEVITGGGGRHLYFRHSVGLKVRTIGPGFDVKGDGGYIVAPPSIHPTGGHYQWDGIAGIEAMLHLAPPPDWLLQCMWPARRQTSVRLTAADAIWRPGERNTRLTSLAGAMRRQGATREAILAALLEQNRCCCKPPLEEAEVLQIGGSIAKYPAAPSPASTRAEVFVPSGFASGTEATWDVIRFLQDHPDFPVLLFFVERTLGCGKPADRVSLSQIVGGVYSARWEVWIRRSCGLSKSRIAAALKRLTDPQSPLLVATRRKSQESGNEPTEYAVNWPEIRRIIEKRKHSDRPPCPYRAQGGLSSTKTSPLVRREDTHSQSQGGMEGGQEAASPPA